MKPKQIVATVGAALGAAVVAGLVADFRSFDQTRGGYEPPYSEYIGDPIDWKTIETTETGMRKDGYVVDVLVNCTTGMMRLQVLGLKVPFRKFSPRALAVHKPREACQRRGFSPDF